MSRERSPEFDAWVDEARNADIADVAARIGAALRRSGRDLVGACPVCGGKDKNEFVCSPSQPDTKKRWLCRKAGKGGDPIAMYMHVMGGDFVAAVEGITGKAPPRGDSGRKADPAAMKERREERKDDDIARREDEEATRRAKEVTAADVWAMRQPIAGTLAARYLAARGITLTEDEAIDLAFAPRLPYRGYRDERSDDTEDLGAFPAMLAAVRDRDGKLIAVHRTYLDPDQPRKLKPPGDRSRNLAKKIVGAKKGGMIRLGFIGQTLVIGEGIETTLSWARLGLAGDDATFAAGVDLGNICGSAADSVAHPEHKDKTVPNGIPDPDRPGLLLPDPVQEVIILGDGDSDKWTTQAKLLTAGRRFASWGRQVLYSMAPDGKDWNDVLLARIARGDA